MHCQFWGFQAEGVVSTQNSRLCALQEQKDFLEDHGLLMRTHLAPTIIDPKAAFTMEYMDMQLMLRFANTTVLYVPSARIEVPPPHAITRPPGWGRLFFSERVFLAQPQEGQK